MPIIAIILVVASFLIPSDIVNSAVVAGPGDGENKEVTSFDELNAVFDLIYGGDLSISENAAIDDEGIVLASYTFGESAEDTNQTKRKKYSSVTMIEESRLESHQEHKAAVGFDPYTQEYRYDVIGKTDVKMSRSLTMYITKNATFYVSRGTFDSVYTDCNSTDSNDTTQTVRLVFDLELYHDEDMTLVKFDKFSMGVSTSSESESNSIDSDYVGKWIRLPAEGEEYIFDLVDSTNRDTLHAIRSLIDESMEDEFEEDDDIYTIERTTVNENDTLVTINLSDPEFPQLLWNMDTDIGGTRNYFYDSIVFSNIDNTVIEVNDDNVIEFDSIEEFGKKCFGG